MKKIIFSNPIAIKNEVLIVNALFDEGLDLFHLRKPTYSENEIIEIVEKINFQNRSKIVLHQQHQVVEKLKIKRIHFSESERLKTSEADLQKWKTKGFTLSTSIHEMKNYDLLSDVFSYTFFGPVFESISKRDYKPLSKELIQLEKNDNRKIKIFAIGGITFDKIEKLQQANFDGYALLGAIWNKEMNEIKELKNGISA